MSRTCPAMQEKNSGRRRFPSSYRVAERLAGGEHGVEYPLNVKLYWSRSGIMHVAIAWDHKPLLYDKQQIQMGLVRSFARGFSHGSGAVSALEPLQRKPVSRLKVKNLF